MNQPSFTLPDGVPVNFIYPTTTSFRPAVTTTRTTTTIRASSSSEDQFNPENRSTGFSTDPTELSTNSIISQNNDDELEPDLSKPNPTISNILTPKNPPDVSAAPRKSTNPQKLYDTNNDNKTDNALTNQTNTDELTTTNYVDVNTVNDNPDFDNDVKNPRGLFNGERGQDQNNDASQGRGFPSTNPGDGLRQILEKSSKPAVSLTTYGEICLDKCEKRGYTYFWCNKKSSKLGQWWESDFCSPNPTITHYGEACVDQCSQRGEKYFWCHKNGGGWGYCSPQPIFQPGSCDTDASYALDGDCPRYIKCVKNIPSLEICQRNYKFDYITQECRFERISRCVGDPIENFP